MKINIILCDDHLLVRSGIQMLVNKLQQCIVIHEASNGKELLEYLDQSTTKTDIILMDISMPIMDGIETTKVITQKYPTLKVIALSVHNESDKIHQMIKAGARAYLPKDASATSLENTIQQVYTNEYYYDKYVIEQMMDFKEKEEDIDEDIQKLSRNISNKIKLLTPREIEFIGLCCSELTYKEIADKMNITQNTVNNYRENVFDKLEIKSRVGIVLFAINHGLFKPIVHAI